jgi:iron complex outermembrane recepter protein
MCSFRSFSIFISSSLLVAAVARAQTVPAPPSLPAAVAGPIQHLDRFIVSAGPDPKSEFDLAQGSAVLTGEELHHQLQATLGDTLRALPGVSSASYGPGASRPLIRGLGGDRVRVLDNGIGMLDASNVSPDHNTAVEPFFASSIEVLRGPSAVLYGTSAVGGVINVIANTIPETAPDGATHGVVEARAGTATRERAGILSIGGGDKTFGVHLNALKRKTGDVRIPGVARIDAAAPGGQPRGTLPDSASDTWSVAGGATAFWSAGHAGASITRYETEYGVPTDEPGLSIKMRHTRYDFSGAVTQPFGVFRHAKARCGFGDYSHSEIADKTTINTTFKNKAAEGRLELVHVAMGDLTGTIGVQGARSDFSAEGEEVVTPPALTHTGALFALEEMKLGPTVTLQMGGRFEGQKIELGEVDPGLPVVAGYRARTDQKKKFSGGSASVGLVFRPAKEWSLGAAVAYTERVPTTQELFSNGPHGGTGAYEVGTTGLGNEKSTGFDVTLRRRTGFLTGSLGAFVNRFNDYIFEEELPATAIPAANNPEGLTPFQFVARDAKFYGAEAEVEMHLLEQQDRNVHLTLMVDYVHAEQTADHQPLPRIPPLRYGARVEYEEGPWRADAEVRHHQRQTRLAPSEADTHGYTLINATLSYNIPMGRASCELFLRGTNLADITAREHTSFLKEFAPMPRRGVLAGVRMTF